MKVFSSKKRVFAAAALILLLLFLLRPGASRLKSRIVLSISSAVGRSVDLGAVHLRLLPRPGFDLENLVVYDDPAFGAEPMLRASEVTADLRLTSLLRGRLEIARLDLTEPSLNLVRGENGHWNLETLLERTAHTPLAPTSKAKSEPRPGFPYIAATSARINFKQGPEKKPYALTNADFALWQDSENAWGVRLKAQPFRTDLNLNDMGQLLVSGTWQRADALRDTPLEFSMEWNRAQLGQLTKFFTGNDQGWRGAIQLDVALVGTPAKLQVTTNASVQDFRRYDITSGQPLRLGAHCEGQYSSVSQAFHDLACNAPVGSGLITLKGDMGLPGSHSYGLTLSVESVPASAVVQLAERAKKSLPDDLTASGTLHGHVEIHQDPTAAKARWEGRGEIADFHLSSAANKAELGAETIPFTLSGGDVPANVAQRPTLRKIGQGLRPPDGAHLEFGPFPVASGRASGPTVRGWADLAGYDASISGEAEIGRMLRLARLAGIPALQTTAEGAAQLDIQIAGSWAGLSHGAATGFSGPQVTGTAKLKNVRIALRGAGGPVELSSAELQLLPDDVHVEKLSAKAVDAVWTGSLELPRGCGTPVSCEVHFNLNANQIALNEVAEWMSPRPKERPWYRVLESGGQAGTPFLASLRAAGRITTDRFVAQSAVATHVSANLKLGDGKLSIAELYGDFLGGNHRGEWQADFSGKPTICGGTGSLSGISLARVSDVMKDGPIAGLVNASYEVKGNCTAEFWSSAVGTLRFDVRNGSLPHMSLTEDAGALRVEHFSGQAQLRAGKFEIKDAKLDSPSGKFQVSGTASLRHEIDLKLARTPAGTPSGYTISGTLAAPRVEQLSSPETQARLKTEPAK